MISVIAFLLVSGCVCAPSGNTTSTSSSSSSSSSSTGSSSSGSSSSGSSSSKSVSSSSTDGNGVVYSITQKFSSSSGVPNITTSLGNVALTQTSFPSFGSSLLSAEQTAAAIKNQTSQTFAAIQKQNQAHFSAVNDMSSSIHQAVKASHAAIQNSMKTMFKPFSIFTSSPFFV